MHVRREDLVLGEDAVNRRTETRDFGLVRSVAVDVIDGEVRANFVANGPSFDIATNSKDLTSHVGAGDDILLLAQRVLALGYDEIAILLSCLMRG